MSNYSYPSSGAGTTDGREQPSTAEIARILCSLNASPSSSSSSSYYYYFDTSSHDQEDVVVGDAKEADFSWADSSFWGDSLHSVVGDKVSRSTSVCGSKRSASVLLAPPYSPKTSTNDFDGADVAVAAAAHVVSPETVMGLQHGHDFSKIEPVEPSHVQECTPKKIKKVDARVDSPDLPPKLACNFFREAHGAVPAALAAMLTTYTITVPPLFATPPQLPTVGINESRFPETVSYVPFAEKEENDNLMGGEGDAGADESAAESDPAGEITFTLFHAFDIDAINAKHIIFRRDIWESFVVSPESANPEDEKTKEGRRVNGNFKRYNGCVAFRCRFCKDVLAHQRAKMAIVFPTKLDTIYRAYMRFRVDHYYACKYIPQKIRDNITRAENTKVIRGEKLSWETSAKLIGLRDGGDDVSGIIYKPDSAFNF